MSHDLAKASTYPKAPNGLTLPLSKSLDWPDLARHRAMVAAEMEVLAQKTDRFGWERDRDTPARERLILDWMDALQDFPLEEVQAGIRAAMDAKPGRTLNEREVLFHVHKVRARKIFTPRHVIENVNPPPTEAEKARINAMLAEAGFKPKRMQEIDDPPLMPEIKAAAEAAEKAAYDAAAAADAAIEKRIMDGNG